MLARDSRGRRHILVTNVDQVLIVASAAEPTLKPNLIDRFLVTAHQAGLRPLITINKVDLIDLANLMPLVGVYSQLGYGVLLVSAKTGLGIDRLRRELAGKASVVAGQSGVGKSSLLNADRSVAAAGGARGQHATTKKGGTRRPPPSFGHWPAAATWSTRPASASSSCGTSFRRKWRAIFAICVRLFIAVGIRIARTLTNPTAR